MNFCNNIFKNQSDNIAIITLDRTYTYKDLDNLSNKLSNWLNKLGFKRDDVIVVQGDNSIETVVIWLASVKSGGCTLFVSNEHSQNSINNIMEQIKVFRYFKQEDITTISQTIDGFSNEFDTVDVDPSDICVLTLTSGTGGEYQKIVKHSHEHTVFAITTGSEYAGVPTKDDTIYGTAGLSFSFGLAYGICVALYYGATSIMTKRLPIMETLTLIKRHNVTMFFSAPVFYRMVLQLECKDYFEDVTICFSGGDYLPTTLRTEWQNKTGKYLTNIIGTAESQYCFSCSKEGVSPDDAIGEVIDGYTVTWDDNGMNVSDYLTSFSTNDKVEVKDNFLYYLGRSNDLLHTYYGKFNPTMVEFIIMNSGLVVDVFAVQYTKMGMLFVQIFCIRKNNNLSERETKKIINEYCVGNLDKHLVPKKITFVDYLPKTVTGKPKRNNLKENL
jgi:acyl-coenzyme A synthetase/AMP-(fatty) acid ligase